MELSKEDADKLLAKVNSKCPNQKCPMCGAVDSFGFEPAEFHQMGFKVNEEYVITTGEAYMLSLFSGTCQNCGFVASFNTKFLKKEK